MLPFMAFSWVASLLFLIVVINSVAVEVGDSCTGAGVDECEDATVLLQHRGPHRSPPDVSRRRAADEEQCNITLHDSRFASLVLGCSVLAEENYPFAHEASVYVPALNILFWSSNRRGPKDKQYIELFTMNLDGGKPQLLPKHIWNRDIVMANGAVLDCMPGSPLENAKSVLISSQGNFEKRSGIFRLDLEMLTSSVVTDEANEEKSQYNSPNDIVIDPVSGALLFTDPTYGFWQNFRPEPVMGNYLWQYQREIATSRTSVGVAEPRLLADKFVRPNGLAFASVAGDVLYVTDTGYFRGGDFVCEANLMSWRHRFLRPWRQPRLFDRSVPAVDTDGPRTVYAFDVVRDSRGHISSLENRRVVLAAGSGVPDGIKVDCDGRLYVGVGNGLAVYTANGAPLVTFMVEHGCANLALVPRGETTDILAMCEKQLWRFSVNASSACRSRPQTK